VSNTKQIIDAQSKLWNDWSHANKHLLEMLLNENDRLNERIKRLCEAGDAIAKTSSCGCPNGESVFYCRTCVSAWDEWDKAKEAKP
jgi:hypothetical protein